MTSCTDVPNHVFPKKAQVMRGTHVPYTTGWYKTPLKGEFASVHIVAHAQICTQTVQWVFESSWLVFLKEKVTNPCKSIPLSSVEGMYVG